MAFNLAAKVQCDIMISHNVVDHSFAVKISEKFTENGWKVWYSDPKMNHVQMLNQKGDAILSCKIFVPIISETSAKDPQCQDELALAYISNSTVFPVGLKRYRDLSVLLDGGMKLMLAKINWTFFLKDEHFNTNMPGLLDSMQKVISDKTADQPDQNETETAEPGSGVIEFHGMNIRVNFNKDDSEGESSESDEDDDDKDDRKESDKAFKKLERRTTHIQYDFWNRNFQSKSEVTWVEFKKAFENDYREKIVRKFSADKMKFFINLIYKDIFTLNKQISKSTYDTFCEGNPDADPHRFYNRLQQYAVGYHAMREVFNMDSSLRLTTIQKLGQFCFPAVISGLSDMLKDEDPNIRAVATIALAKSGRAQTATIDKIITKLEDEDRLVRESACLALGSLKAGSKSETAVANRWRNDPIKSVREAAEVALKRMGGELSKKCIHVTEVLSSEMQFLKTPTT